MPNNEVHTFGDGQLFAILGNQEIPLGEIANMNFRVTRETAPRFRMGESHPRSFSRAARGLDGPRVYVEAFNTGVTRNNTLYTTMAIMDAIKDAPNPFGDPQQEYWDGPFLVQPKTIDSTVEPDVVLEGTATFQREVRPEDNPYEGGENYFRWRAEHDFNRY